MNFKQFIMKKVKEKYPREDITLQERKQELRQLIVNANGTTIIRKGA